MTDVIIISTKPEKKASYYAQILSGQTVSPERLILVRAPMENAGKGGFSAQDGQEERDEGTGIPCVAIGARENAPGYLLTLGIRASSSESLLFLHEDVTALSPGLIEKLTEAVREGAGMAFSRTVPGKPAVRIRDAYQAFYNPETSELRTEETLFRKGFLQFVTGDSAVMVTRDALERSGGFPLEMLVSPFSMTAAEVFYEKKALFYEAEETAVREPESASLKAVFHNAFDLAAGMQAYSQTFGLYHKYYFKDKKKHKHPVILMSRPAMYTKKLFFSARMLSKAGRPYKVPGLVFLYLTELLADLLGNKFQLLPVKLSRAFSGQRAWFSD
ncbi:MAG: hypothetical protein IJL78_10800 [Lachnospiraceae bacterium]|nr:hypothetical protein [Lachnospiraceae bacterium]